MKYTILFAVGFVLINNAVVESRNPNARIMGGNDTTINQYSFYGAILFRNVPVCGAALIRNNAVVTSTSCIIGYRPDMVTVQLGSAVPGDGQIVNVLRFCHHPLYNASLIPAVDYDVTVVTLSSYVYITTTIKLIPLRTVNLDVPTGKLATVVGFGTSSFGGAPNKILQALDLPRIRDIDCQRSYRSDELTDRMICFGYPEGKKDACNAGGSPLVYANSLVGIDSWSYGCGFPNTPRIFTRVYNEEIQNQILKCL